MQFWLNFLITSINCKQFCFTLTSLLLAIKSEYSFL